MSMMMIEERKLSGKGILSGMMILLQFVFDMVVCDEKMTKTRKRHTHSMAVQICLRQYYGGLKQFALSSSLASLSTVVPTLLSQLVSIV
jgi:hypothetical protein